MKFKNIFFITIILLTILSVSAVSATDDLVDNDIVEADISFDNIDEVSVIGLNESSPEEDNPAESSILSNDVTKYCRNETQYHATFFDSNSTPIVSQKIPITINGDSYQRTTNANGTITFNINLNPGKYVLTVVNPVTNESASNNITVLPTLNASDVVKSFKNETQYLVNVVDGQGKPLVGGKVQFNINGVFYNRTTDNKGIAKMNINLNSGKYVITAENLNNGERISNNITVLSTVNGKDVKLYFRNGTPYVVSFTNSQGKPLANTKVKFNINGVAYERTTNENGTVKFNINLNPGKYVITAYNPKTTEYGSNTVEVLNKIVCKNSQTGQNVSIEYNNNEKYTVELHEADGSLAKHKTITFNINGVFYNRTSDDKGIASLNIKLLPGNYIITGEFGGCKLSNTIKVRVTPSVKLLTPTVKTGQYIKFELHEKISGNPVTGNHYGIVLYNNTPFGDLPDSNGLCQIQVGLPPESYLFYIGMIDDGWYKSLWSLNTVKVTA